MNICFIISSSTNFRTFHFGLFNAKISLFLLTVFLLSFFLAFLSTFSYEQKRITFKLSILANADQSLPSSSLPFSIPSLVRLNFQVDLYLRSPPAAQAGAGKRAAARDGREEPQSSDESGEESSHAQVRFEYIYKLWRRRRKVAKLMIMI